MRPTIPARSAFAASFIAALLCLPPSPSCAESWGPYLARRDVDSTGRWSVVLKPANEGRGANFDFAEAPSRSTPVTPIAPDRSDRQPCPEVVVRDGDVVLASGTLESAPLEVRVSTKGYGFAAMVEHGGVGRGVTFAWVRRDGAVPIRKRLEDIFSDDEIEAFGRGWSTWWLRHAWIDDDAREVILVSERLTLHAIDFETGEVRKAGAADVKRAISHVDPAVQVIAIELTRKLRLEGIEDSLACLLGDSSTALRVRVRAAAALAERHDARGNPLIVATARMPRGVGIELGDYEIAIAHLSYALGTDAIAHFQAAMRGVSTEGWSGAIDGFAALGEASIPTLVAMLSESGQSNDYRGGAAHALGLIGSATPLPALLAAITDREEYVASAAASAAAAIGKAAISKELAVLLDRPTRADHPLASYFREVKEPTAVGPLVRCLVRRPTDDCTRDIVRRALMFQTGVDLGADAAAWAAWFAKQPR